MNREQTEQGAPNMAALKWEDGEKHLLSGLMLDTPGDMAKAIDAGLDADCFSVPGYKALFLRMGEQYKAGGSLTPAALYTVMTKRELEGIGGNAGLMDISAALGSTAFLQDDVRRLAEYRDKRKLREELSQAISECENGERKPADILAPLLEMGTLQAAPKARAITAKDAMKEAVSVLEQAVRNGGMLGIESGFPRLDSILSGLQGGHFYIVGARPGVGKTAFALGVACHVAGNGGRVAFITAEMTAARLAERMAFMMAARLAERTENKIAEVSRADVLEKAKGSMKLYMKAAVKVGKLPVIFLDATGKGADEVALDTMLEHRRAPLALVVVDYLQRIRAKGSVPDSVVEQIGETSRKLCDMGKALNVPVLALAQLNRESAKGADARMPVLTDLKGSGDIEQDADAVILLHRPDAVAVRDDDARREQSAPALIVAKNRDGEQGIIPLAWNGPCMSYTEVTMPSKEHA